MTEQGSSLPILDCATIALNLAKDTIGDEAVKTFGEKLVSTLVTHGACYVKNYGIDNEVFDKYLYISRNFFLQPDALKAKIERPLEKNFSWIKYELEGLNPDRPRDRKEVFIYNPGEEEGFGSWPDVEFELCTKSTHETFAALVKRFFDSLSLGLGQEKCFMSNAHKAMGNKGSQMTLRSAFYPSIIDDASIKPDQLRCGEHTDYGTMTLLFQDQVGGLEIEIPGKGFVAVPYIPNTLVMMTGALLQRWTSDAITAASHRAIIPDSEDWKRAARQSIVFFTQPDDDFVVKPLDGSSKYKPVTSMEYQKERFYGTGPLHINSAN